MTDLIEKINEIVKELPYDLRMEVLVNILIDDGIERDDIVISPKSLFKRKFHRDVENTIIADYNRSGQYVLTEINREGMYDALPEILMHGSRSDKKGTKTINDMAAEVKERRIEEAAARKFFLPFENEFYHQSVTLEFEERTILYSFLGNYRYAVLLNKYWQLPAFLDDRQKATFIYLIPIIHKAVGDLNLTKLCYEAVFNIEINFTCKNGAEQTVLNAFNSGNDNVELGVNFICGNNFYDYTEIIEILCGPLNEEQLKEYLPGGKGNDVIEFLNGYFLPYHIATNVDIVTGEDQRTFILDNESLKLGYTSYL